MEGEFAALVQTPVVDLLDENDLTLSMGKPEKKQKNFCLDQNMNRRESGPMFCIRGSQTYNYWTTLYKRRLLFMQPKS